MNCKSLNTMLIEHFPNLKAKYIEEVSWQEGDDTGSHVVYGDVLTPYLMNCMSNNEIEEIKRIFNFIEKVLELRQNYSDEVIAYSVLESILPFFERDKTLENYLGHYTKKLLSELQ